MRKMEEWYTGKAKLSPSFERIKKFLIYKFGPGCWECGWMNKNPFTGKWVIDLDHVDGDHKNYSPTNFRLLCPNCHAMTPTYKTLNTKAAKEARGPCALVIEPWLEDFESGRGSEDFYDVL